MNNTSLTSGLSEAEQQIVMSRLYELLDRQTTRYLSGDSTSIPVETAEGLLHSIVCTLRTALSESGISERELLTGDITELFLHGRRILQDKLTAARDLWEKACMTAPLIPNVYLRDTLRSFKVFFKRYDLCYFAHQIPCAIDYPLCIPVSEELFGVLYVTEWLHRILIENWFLMKLPTGAVTGILSEIAADYTEYPMNLCEQPIINAVGLAMLGRSAVSLELSADDCRKLADLLFGCTDISAELNRGIARAVWEMSMPNDAEDYIRTVIEGILPRITAARQSDDVRGIFIAGAR